MTTKSQQIQVGLFSVIGVALVALSILLIGGDKILFKNYIHLKAYFPSVQGLAKGSVVSLAGLTVGNVQSIEFDSATNQVAVILKVDSKHASRLYKNSLADIKTQGALGDRYIYISLGSAESGLLNNNDEITVVTSPDILGILASRGGETEKFFDILTEVHLLTKTLNQNGRISSVLKSLDLASQNLNSTSLQAQKLMVKISENKALERLDSVAAKIDDGEGTLGLLINDPAIHNQLKGLLGGGSSKKDFLKNVLKTSIESSAK